MKKQELKNCPKWLLDADTLNENVRWSYDDSLLIWEGGEFRGGEFRGGEFRGGYFRGGYFRGGEFRGGEFLGGEFLGGEFRGGYFLGGYFLGGEFLGGEFLGGEFRGGYFRGGEFRGGEFRGGYFLGGYFLGGEFLGGEFRGGEFRGGEFRGFIKSKHWGVKVFETGLIGVGCKTKSLKEWGEWFDGTEEFIHKRDSEAFKYIKGHFMQCKAYLFFLRDFEPHHPVIKKVKFD